MVKLFFLINNSPCFQAEIEVIEQYSDPRDSKSRAYVEPGAEVSLPVTYSKINRDYCRPYTGKLCLGLCYRSYGNYY